MARRSQIEQYDFVSIAELRAVMVPEPTSLPSPERDLSKQWTVALLVASPLLYAGISQLLGQDTDWDLQNYHFFDSYWLLVNHMRDLTPAQLQTYISPILDVPFYLAADHISPRLTGYLVAAVQGLSFPLLYLINRHFTSRRWVALSLAGLGMLSAGALSELGTIMGDTLVAPLFFGAILIGLHSLDASRSQKYPRLARATLIVSASALAGVAAGLKLAELPIAVGIAAAFPLVSGTVFQRIGKGLLAIGGLALGILRLLRMVGIRAGNPVRQSDSSVHEPVLSFEVCTGSTEY